MRPMRVVSLLPSATDLLYAIGAGHTLVGRSAFCDAPTLPVVNDEASLNAINPDVVLAACDCSLAPTATGATVVSFNPTSIFDVFDDCLRLGEAVGCEAAADRVMVGLRSRYWSAVDFVNPYVPGPRILMLEWLSPLRVAGLWTPLLIEAAGGIPILNEPDQASTVVTDEEVIAAAPDRIIVSPCGCALDSIQTLAGPVTEKPWWNTVDLVDGQSTFSRPGPRLVDAFEWLVSSINDRPRLMPRGFPVRTLSKDSL